MQILWQYRVARGKRHPEAAFRRAGAKKTSEKRKGEVRPAARARNQAREPRRRKGAPAPARVSRETGSRLPDEPAAAEPEARRTMTKHDISGEPHDKT